MGIKAIVWDLGGVLLRTEDRLPRSDLAKELDLTYDEIDQLVFSSPSARQASRGEITAAEHWHNVCGLLAWPEERVYELQNRFWGGDRLDEALLELNRSLKPDFTLALLSNNWSDLRPALKGEWQIADLFDEIIISAEVGLVKPDPRIYQLTQASLEIAPEEILFIDDFIENVDAARAQGWQAIHFRNSRQAFEDINARIARD